MPDRLNPILRITCIVLLGLIVFQLAQFVTRKDPLAGLALASSATASMIGNAPAADAGPSNSIASSAAPTSGLETNPIVPATNIATTASNPAVRRTASSAPPQPQGPPLDSAAQARVDRITASELFAAVVRPLPMALLGIAGRDAFIRTPMGQTGLLREGDELGGLKLLRIGTNRVLVEHEQQKKELMLFSGFGGETLMPQGEKK